MTRIKYPIKPRVSPAAALKQATPTEPQETAEFEKTANTQTTESENRTTISDHAIANSLSGAEADSNNLAATAANVASLPPATTETPAPGTPPLIALNPDQSRQDVAQLPQTGQSKSLVRRDRVFKFLMPAASERLDLSHGTILYMEDVSVAFDGFKAINNLNFYVNTGELRCVIGPNGAGKTTMMDIITGKTRPDSGSVYFGQSIDLLDLTESEIAEAGIGRKFQKPTVFEAMTVKQNLELAMAGDKRFFSVLRSKLSGEQIDRIEDVASIIGLLEHLEKRAGSLSHGQKQWLEIGLLLMQRPHLLLVDEPVAGMTHAEMDRTGELLLQLAGEHTVVVVEHDMEFVRSIATDVTVLHQGSVLAEGSMNSIQNNAEVRSVYLGE